MKDKIKETDKVKDRIQLLRNNLEVGKLYKKIDISKLFGISQSGSTCDTALAEITFFMPELFETDNGKIGINCRWQ